MAFINKEAIYAKIETTPGERAEPTKADEVPINTISNTPIQANEVENPRKRPFFGAADKAIASRTQAITITSSVVGGGVNNNVPQDTPFDALIQGCYHTKKTVTKALADASGNTVRGIIYNPVDTGGVGVSLRYLLDDIVQDMTTGRGTMSMSFATGAFPEISFDYQGPFKKPVGGAAPSSGTAPTYIANEIVTGAGTLVVPGAPANTFGDCVRSFSFTQNSTLSLRDCANQTGGRQLEYLQTGRDPSGEIVVDLSKEMLVELYKLIGTTNKLSAPLGPAVDTRDVDGRVAKVPSGFVVFGTEPGNIFAFGSNAISLGAPTQGDTDGFATYTIPLTFHPKAGQDDYQFGWFGDVS